MPKPSDGADKRARNWIATWNNPPGDAALALQEMYEATNATYVVG